MNIEQARVEIRQRSLLEVVDLAFRYVVDLGGRLYLKLWLVYCLPWVVALYACARLLELSWWWLWLIAVCVGQAVQAVFTVAAGRLMFQRTTSVREVTSQLGSRLGALLGALLLSRVLLLLSSLVLIITPFVWARFAFLPEAVLLEGASSTKSLGRAGRIVQHDLGFTLGLGLWLTVLTACVMVASEVLGQALVRDVLQLGEPLGSYRDGGSVFLLLGYTASWVMSGTLRFLAYINVRTRWDGWDVQVRFMALRAQLKEAR
ncbi:MAG: hypothetical protein KIT72_04045 [Polyangiaceae bacterium]|nr:hypothetical protein [Polyangiaceae bacterium]MCW5789575.1 hypothetical protein [Polyangiaceae bacterium]